MYIYINVLALASVIMISNLNQRPYSTDFCYHPRMDNSGDRRPMLMAAIVPLSILALFICTFRIIFLLYWQKVRDYTIIFFTSLTFLAYGCTIVCAAVAASHGFGTHISAVLDTTLIDPLSLAWITGAIASGSARISNALVVLPSCCQFHSREFLTWPVITLYALSTVSYVIVQALGRRDIVTSQLESTRRQAVVYSSFAAITMFALGDILCVTICIRAICRLRIGKSDKLAISLLMSLSLLAIPFAVLKVYYLVDKSGTTDPMWDLMPEFLWSRAEEATTIIAAYAPTLRGPFGKLVVWLKSRLASSSAGERGQREVEDERVLSETALAEMRDWRTSRAAASLCTVTISQETATFCD